MRTTVLLVTALVVLGASVPLAAGSPASPSASSASTSTVSLDVQENDTETNESENETAPGAQLAGVVGVQGAEVAGEMEERSFGLRVAAANSNASKAAVVAEQTESLQSRLTELQERKEELRDAKQNGDISQSRFRGEMAELAIEISSLQRLSNKTSETARSVPVDALTAKNVDTEALGRIQQDAGELGGPEMAEIARDIAGPPSNRSQGPPGADGPPGNGPATGDADQNTTDDNTTVTPGNASDGTGDGPPVTTPGNGTSAPGNGTDNPGNGPLDGTHLHSLAEPSLVTL